MATFPKMPKPYGLPTLPIAATMDRIIRLPGIRDIKLPEELIEKIKKASLQHPLSILYAKILLSLLGENYRLAKIPILSDLHPWFSKSKTNVSWIPINQDIERPQGTALPIDVVKYFVKKSKYRFIPEVCACRMAYSCNKYPTEIGCLMLGESAAEIASLLGRLVSVEEALEHLDRAIEAGLVPVIGKARVDNDIFRVKDRGKLLTVCLCCECCCFTRYTRHFRQDTLDATFFPPEGLRLSIDEEKCTGCGYCETICYIEAMQVLGGRATPNERCRICGRCATECPSQAIKITIDNERLNEDLISRLESAVDMS